ncbi:MAG: TlyA family RNA methyltransferase [Magnetococcales bacterium]|nr:TlyA family RNA methyltransferase [Magnetococcales bacterium]MBF0148648.1 TlyA family RNA methyltransferase [Magnetococcales bacterium]MBF0174082.1 TlyA family RNA methyltransferase [Magnetococcales bacterium]MBF0630889.1 TlyA family RNA methyltransferase [Magnetococcales bacterium]
MSGKKRDRLDQRVWTEGFADTLELAQRLIMAGTILVDDHPVTKPGTLVSHQARLRHRTKPSPWVSRGGIKLAHAIDTWSISLADKTCLDVGASTGGFTQVLLHHGANKVIAMDVGYGQLDWKLVSDPRVVVMDRFNIRDLQPSDLPEGVDFIVVDVSFIALTRILSPLHTVLNTGGEGILLVKPQFELPPHKVATGGIVHDEHARQQAVTTVTDQCHALGFKVIAVTPAPVTGAKGNQEYLLYFSLTKNNQGSEGLPPELDALRARETHHLGGFAPNPPEE